MASVPTTNRPICNKSKFQSLSNKTQKTVKSNKTEKTNFRLKKLPAAMVSKWQKMPQTLQNTILTLLEESLSPFTCSGEQAVDHTLNKIRVRVQHSLCKIKVPKERWNDVKSLSSAQRMLNAEKERLDDLEATLQAELRQFEQQETKKGKFENSVEMNSQMSSSP